MQKPPIAHAGCMLSRTEMCGRNVPPHMESTSILSLERVLSNGFPTGSGGSGGGGAKIDGKSGSSSCFGGRGFEKKPEIARCPSVPGFGLLAPLLLRARLLSDATSVVRRLTPADAADAP